MSESSKTGDKTNSAYGKLNKKDNSENESNNVKENVSFFENLKSVGSDGDEAKTNKKNIYVNT